jgi:pantothenate synthetase
MRVMDDHAMRQGCGAESEKEEIIKSEIMRLKEGMKANSRGRGYDMTQRSKRGHLKRSLFVEQAIYSQEFNALPKICPEKINKVAPV